MILSLLFSLSLPAVPAFADSVPVLKCPAVPENYNQLLTKIRDLKSAIKNTAACEAVRTEVSSLESLFDERERVGEIVRRSREAPVAEAELQRVRTFVESVTQKTFATAELLGRNSGCFEEDRKQIGLGDLAAITLDATTVAKTVAGPWSVPIAIGGQALAGIFQGLDKVVKAQRGYAFEQLPQRQAFVQSLCSYYGIRQDMDALLFPQRRYGQIRALEVALERNLGRMIESCPDCARIVSLKESSGAAQNAHEINRLAAGVDREFARPLGSVTVQSLSTLDWARKEVARIREESGDEFGIGRDLLSEMRADMDRFLFEKEAPRFLQFQGRKSYDLFREFSMYVKGEGQALALSAARHVTVDYAALYRMSETELMQHISSLRLPLEAKSQSSLAGRIADFERKSSELLDRTALALDVQDSYCTFFRKAGLYNGNLQSACESMIPSATRRNLARMDHSRTVGELTPAGDVAVRSASAPMMTMLSSEEVSTDWVENLTRLANRLAENPGQYERRLGGGSRY